MTLTEIVQQLRSCGYECEAETLEANIAFAELERMALATQGVPEERIQWQPVGDGTYPGSDPQMGTIAISGGRVTMTVHGFFTGSVLLPEHWRIFSRTTGDAA